VSLFFHGPHLREVSMALEELKDRLGSNCAFAIWFMNGRCWRNRHFQPRAAFSRFPPVRWADLKGPLRVGLTRSPSRPRTAATCAFLPAGIDAKRLR
jgi:hypothetical protein